MTNRKIITKAIKKAESNGYESEVYFRWEDYDGEVDFADWEYHEHIYELIYDHDFAKALWGEAVYGTLAELRGDAPPNKLPHWKYHLQQMVIADDPIKYLGENM
jgi:hypothetical protein